MRDITLKIKGDTKDLDEKAKKSFERIQAAADKLSRGNVSAKQFFGGMNLKDLNHINDQFKQVAKTASFATGGIGLFASLAVGYFAAVGTAAADLTAKAIQLGANFESVFNSIKVFSGSTAKANIELAALEKTAFNSAGLRLESAQTGYKNLRALGFQADISRKFLKELGEEKIFSGASDDALNKIVFNFGQILSGGQKVSQELREMFNQMPSLRKAFFQTFGSLDPNVIQSAFDDDANGAVEKFLSTLEKAKPPILGLNDSIGKFADSWIVMAQEFAKPIVPELSKDIQGLTRIVYENRDAFVDAGRNIRDGLKSVRETYTDVRDSINPLIEKFKELKQNSDFFKDFAKNPVGDGFSMSIDKIRKGIDGLTKGTRFETNFGERAFFKQFNSALDDWATNAEETYSENQQTFVDMIYVLGEISERERTKELGRISDNYSARQSITENFFNIQAATLNRNLRYTATEELAYQQKSAALQKMQFRQQTAEAQAHFSRLLELNKGDKDAIEKINNEKTRTIGKLNAQMVIAEISSMKQIAETEKRIQDERRQSLINFKELQIKQSQFSLDNRKFDIERQIARNLGDAENTYDELKKITENTYKEISRLTLESYQEQLKNQSLTKEQRLNLTTQMFLDEQKLAEENRRAIILIEDKKADAVFARIRQQADRRTQFYKNQQETANVFSSIVGLDVPQSGFLRSIIDGANQAAVVMEEGLNSRFRELNNQIEAARLKLSQITDEGEKAKNSGYIAGLKKQLEDVNFEILDLQNGYPKAQKGILDLFDSLTKGVSKYTIFDEIIQKNYEAERALGRNILETEISALKRELEATKRFVDAGTIAPNELAPKETALRAAQQRLIAFDLSTKIGNANLQTRANLLEKIKALQTGDKAAIASIQYQAEISQLKEKYQLIAENIALESGYYKDSETLALRRKNILLQYEREVYELREELSQKTVFSANQADARFLDYLNSQVKSISDIYADAKIGIVETFWNGFEKQISKVTDKMGAFGDVFKQTLLDLTKLANSRSFLTKITTGLLDKFLPSEITDKISKTGNPVLDENIKQTKYLKEISDVLNGKPSVSPSGIGRIFGGGQSGGLNLGGIFGGNAGGGIFNLGGGNSSGENGLISTNGQGINSTITMRDGRTVSTGGGILSNLKNLFSTKDGGIFAGRPNLLNGGKTSRMGGIMGGIGDIAALAGGLIGGRVGGILSSAGTGMSIGSMFGPWGAAIGAGVGALFGLFSGDPKRKRDKKEKLPQLQSGFADALAQLRQLAADTRSLRVDPDSAISKAQELRTAIASGFGIQFESKKYSKQSQSQIAAKLTEADSIIAQIREAADMARAANSRNNRILPEFASGGAISERFTKQYENFKDKYGILRGGIPGKDSIPVLAKQGELFANERQQKRIRDLAGFDVFAYAGIPNYPKTKMMADGGFIGTSASAPVTANNSPKFTIELDGVIFTDESRAFLRSADGHREIIEIVKNGKKNKEI